MEAIARFSPSSRYVQYLRGFPITRARSTRWRNTWCLNTTCPPALFQQCTNAKAESSRSLWASWDNRRGFAATMFWNFNS
eukprot:1944706-Pyramimonas_sp.AAC.1